MNVYLLRAAGLAALALASAPVLSADADIDELKQMIQQMKQDYETRIQALETRLQAAEASVASNTEAVTTAPPAATGTATARGSTAFNPAISLVVQGAAAAYSRDPDNWALPGFQTGGEAGVQSQGLSLTETELTASANVDDWFYGQATLGIHDEDGSTAVELEEAFIDTLSLPAGLGLRVGRFFTEVGYTNTKHAHAWDFADAPLTSQAFLGKQYGDDGLRLSWLAPTDTFIELGFEMLRGQAFPAAADSNKALGGAHNAFVRVGADVGDSHSFRIGASHLRTEPKTRESGHAHGGGATETFSFAGDSNLSVLDLVWKWAPDGDARTRNLVLQAEYFHRNEKGQLTFTNPAGGALLPYDGSQDGFYAQAVYQFMPRWRSGIRYDQLSSDNNLRVLNNTSGEADSVVLDESGLQSSHDPYRWTLMFDYAHSEFDRLRLQLARDYSRPGAADDQVFLQYIMALGAHGAHEY